MLVVPFNSWIENAMRVLIVLMLSVIQAQAAAVAPAKLMQEMEGVYKHRFRNGIITPGKAPM
jgi:hypothetical protein